jgi:hypothetical protein
MNMKKSAIVLAMALSFSAISVSAFAAEEAASGSAVSTGQIVPHIEQALVEVSKSDFSAAQIHLKAARTAAEHIAGSSDAAKQAYATLIQGQIKSKVGDVAGATEVLNKALSQFKAL